jgi:hypothetical protein
MKTVIVCAILFVSCSSYLTVAETTREYSSDYESIYNATIKYCKDSGVIVDKADKDNGIITTTYSPSLEYKHHFNIRSKNGKTVVLLSLHRRSYNGSDSPMVYTDFLDIYKNIFNTIGKNLAP